MIAYQQQGGDAGLAEAHDPFTPFPLIGGGWVLILVGIAGKQNAVHLLADRGVNDLVQGPQEVMHPQGQTAGRVAPAVGGDVDMGISKVKDSGHLISWKGRSPSKGGMGSLGGITSL